MAWVTSALTTVPEAEEDSIDFAIELTSYEANLISENVQGKQLRSRNKNTTNVRCLSYFFKKKRKILISCSPFSCRNMTAFVHGCICGVCDRNDNFRVAKQMEHRITFEV